MNATPADTKTSPSFHEQREQTETDLYAQLMMDAIPMLCAVWDENGKMVDCNLEALRLFGLRKKSDYISRFYELNPEFQPDGTASRVKADAYIQKAMETGFQHFEWEFRTLDGDDFPASVLLIRVPWKGGYRVLSYAHDLKDIKKAATEIDRQTRLFHIMNQIAANLMRVDTRDVDQTIVHQFEILGVEIGADRVYLWENQELEGKSYARKIYEWTTNIRDQTGDLMSRNAFEYDSVPYLRDMMMSDRSINTTVEQLPKPERMSLEIGAAKMVLTIPISHDGAPWGFIGFENLTRTTPYAEIDEKVLRSCGVLVVSAIARNRMSQRLLTIQSELTTHEKLLRAVNEVGALLLERRDSSLDDVVLSCMEILAESVDASSISLWQNTEREGTLYARCLFNWNVAGEPVHDLEIDLGVYIPEWGKTATLRSDLDLPMYRMNANMQNLPLWREARSILLLPLHIEGGFWGFFSFSYRTEERRFSLRERNILWTGSLNIASALVRHEIRESLTDAENRATYDNLTGIENRNSFFSRAPKIFAQHQHKGLQIVILFLDIDHFKRINDQYGHDFGDQVLVCFAETLKKNIRPEDLLCRYGGEEFLLMMPVTGKEAGIKVCERILQRVRALAFENDPAFRFTTSIGLMAGVPTLADSLENYIKKADEALYMAKSGGRDQVVVYSAA